MIWGGLQSGLQFEDFEQALSQAALAHYNDFGHSLIYVTKAGALIRRLGMTIAGPVLISLVQSLIFAAREDKIPEFQAYAPTLEAWNREDCSDMPDDPDSGFSLQHWRKFGIAKALQATLKCRHVAADDLYEKWLTVNALNLLSFDIAQQDKVNVSISGNVGWLSFTHAITFLMQYENNVENFLSSGLKACCRWPVLVVVMLLLQKQNMNSINGSVIAVVVNAVPTKNGSKQNSTRYLKQSWIMGRMNISSRCIG